MTAADARRCCSLLSGGIVPIGAGLGRPEHHEYRWMTAAEAQRLLNPRLRRVSAWACERIGG